MRNLIALLIFLSTTANATNITIADFSKTYEHQFTNCQVNLSNTEFLYASCAFYAAPFITDQQSNSYSRVFDEIGINGVYWHGCSMVGNPLVEIRFECNAVSSLMEFEVVDEYDRPVHNWFRFYRPYYGPYAH